jgi:hypothetical protein
LFQDRRTVLDDTLISLTSYGSRINLIYPTLKSLILQSKYRCSIYLHIHKSDEHLIVERLKKYSHFGVKIVLEESDLKQYLKIVPASREHKDKNIITVDDDIIYHKTMVAELRDSLNYLGQKLILGHRGRLLKFSIDGKSVDYANSKLFNVPNSPNENLLLTGVGGVLYPKGSLLDLYKFENSFLEICPTNDDIWLYFFTRKLGWNSCLVESKRRKPFESAAGKVGGLWKVNNLLNKNEQQFVKAIEYFNEI